jgi:hypothetical protein
VRRSDGFAALPEFSKQDRTQRGSESMRRILQMAALATLAALVKILMNLKHADGTSSTLSVVADAGHKHHLVFINQGAAAYRTWLGVVKAPVATRPLADYELEALQRILGSR